MKVRSGIACVISAVAAVSFLGVAQAADLRWDADGAGGVFGADGSGSWDLSSPLWNNTPATTNLTWVQGSNAVFGDPANTAGNTANSFNVSVNDEIVVNDIQINNASNGGAYVFDSPNFNSLTVNGNIIKNGNAGPIRFDLLAGPFVLGAGNHTIALRDTPGGDNPEMAINANISGSGGLILDNRQILTSPKESWGTLTSTGINSYTGLTQIKYGRFVISQSAGLGDTSAGTVISEAGTLSVGGVGAAGTANLTISEPITITRNTYTGGDATDSGAFSHYGAAIITENGTGSTTFNGPFVVDSNDARIAAFTGTATITSNIQAGPNATLPMLSVTGDFAGFVHLTGNNTALTGGVTIVSAVELNVDNDNQIGGAGAPFQFTAGGTYHPVGGYATSFGTHVLNNATFNGGVDIDDTKTFTIDQALGRALGDDTNRVGSLGKRGKGTLNINSPVNLRGGQTFWDLGTVNVNSTVELANLHLRSPTVNIGTGGSVTTVAGFNSFGQDSTGTSGAPDIAVINITGNGKLIQTSGDDFNISDNANTQGTIFLKDTGVLTTGGIVALGKNAGAIGTINQSGGALTVNRTGNFGFVLGDRNGTGNYNLSGGTFVSAGETYVGQGGAGVGNWIQTSGTATVNNWFVIGRESGQGTMDISGGTFIKAGGGSAFVGEGDPTKTSTMTVRGTGNVQINTGNFWVAQVNGVGILNLQGSAVMTVAGGEFWVGQDRGNGTFNLQGAASLTVNNWFAVGRANAASVGVVNMSGGTLTKQGGGFLAVGSGGTGTFNQTGGALLSNGTYVGEASNGTMNISGGTSTFTGAFSLGQNGGVIGTLNISGTANVTAPAIVFGNNGGTGGGVLTLSGGSFKATSLANGAGTGAKTFTFNGGTFATDNYALSGPLVNTGTGLLSPGVSAAIGTTTIANGYTQGATAGLNIDLSSAASNDSVVVSAGSASLAGPINLALLGGYVPALYTPVTIVTAPAVTGIFSGVNGIVASPTRRLAVTYDGTSVKVQAAEPGDANLNGTVNFADLVILAQNYNTTGRTWVQGDFSGDGTVSFPDLVALAQFYNQPATFQADWAFAQSIAPEPTSLMVLGFAGLLGMRKRSR